MVNINKLIGCEAIHFQMQSKLGKRLTDLFQTIIDYRDNLDYSKIPNEITAQRNFRVKAVSNFFKNSIVEKFKKIVSEETGLTVKRIFSYGGDENGIMGLYAVDLSFGDVESAMENMDRMTSTGSMMYTSDREAVEDMMSIAEAFDPKTGRLTKQYFGKDKKIAVDMYFDINTAFLIADFYPKAYAEPFTAGEIAAIMMHEIGHVLTVSEHMADVYATKRRLETYMNFMKKNDFKSVGFLKALKEIAVPKLKELAKRDFGNKVANDSMRRLVNTLVAGINGINDMYDKDPEPESWITTAFHVFGNILLMGVILLGMLFSTIGILTPLMLLIHTLEQYQYVNENMYGKKSSDVNANFTNTYQLERWADEFVARHGMGAELSSGLNKLFKYFENYTGSYSSHRLRQSTLWNCLIVGYNWLFDKLCLFSYLDPVGYENQYNRVMRILQNTYGFFKNTNVPPKVIEYWIRNVEDIKQNAKNAKKMSDTELAKVIYRMLKLMTNPVEWVVMIKDGSLDRDTEILANRIDDLLQNPLYYQAAKLKSLR